jgi:hypothetical protein
MSEEWREECSYVLMELNAKDRPSFSSETLNLAGLHTGTPLMEIGNEIWEGVPSTSLGTILLFDGKKEYLASTTHVIKMQKMKVTEQTEQITNH